MIREHQKFINICNMISDGILIYLSYFIALFVRFKLLSATVSIPLWKYPFPVIIAFFTVGVILAYNAMHMYGSYRFNSHKSENFTVFEINGIAVIFLTVFLYNMRILNFSRWRIILFWLISSGLVILKRILVRNVLIHYRKLGYNQKHVIVIGNGNLAQQYINNVENNPQYGIHVDGYVSRVEKENMKNNLGSYEDLAKILEKHPVDELVIALEPHEIRFIKYAIDCANNEGIGLSLISFFNDLFPSHVVIDSVGTSHLINIRSTPMNKFFNAMLKRTFDIVGSIFGIILTSPIMLFAVIGIKLTSPGPILFKQDRIGLNKVPFKMLKFRSMAVNNSQDTGWTTNDDPRKTVFGSFIRKYSIDELPQLFNVLKGDMSLVGPRPEVPFHVREFKKDIPLYLLRQQVRPGMTGLAQVNGLRGDTSIEERVKYDIKYIQNWSLWLDISILFKTIFGGFKNQENITKKESK